VTKLTRHRGAQHKLAKPHPEQSPGGSRQKRLPL